MIRRRGRMVWIPISMILLVFSTIGANGQALDAGKFPVGSYIDGDFIATFTADGKFLLHTDDFLKAEGVYAVNKDEITIKEKGGSGECAGTGKYKWQFDGKALHFSKIEDPCRGRIHHMTSRRWPMI